MRKIPKIQKLSIIKIDNQIHREYELVDHDDNHYGYIRGKEVSIFKLPYNPIPTSEHYPRVFSLKITHGPDKSLITTFTIDKNGKLYSTTPHSGSTSIIIDPNQMSIPVEQHQSSKYMNTVPLWSPSHNYLLLMSNTTNQAFPTQLIN